MKTREQIEKELLSFSGGSDRLSKLYAGMCCTDGVRYLIDAADCWWLVSIVCSYQGEVNVKALGDYQFWNFTCSGEGNDRKGVVTCKADTDIPPVVTQEITFTDFPLDSIDLWVHHDVVMLPSEY